MKNTNTENKNYQKSTHHRTVTNRSEKRFRSIFFKLILERRVMSPKRRGDGGSSSPWQKRPPVPLPCDIPDPVHTKRNSSTPIVSDTTSDKGGADKNMKTSNKNLAQGKENDSVHSVLHTVTSYGTRPKVQELQHVTNTQVRSECVVMYRVYILL